MKNLRTIAIAAIFLLILGLFFFFLLRGRLPFMDRIKTRSTITKYPVVTVPQKVNKKKGGPDLPSGMRSLSVIRLRCKVEGLPIETLKGQDSTGSSEGEGREREKGLTVDMALGDERITERNIEIGEDLQFTCETSVDTRLFEKTDIVKNLTITYPGYPSFVKDEIPLKKVDKETKEVMLDKITFRKE